MNDSKLCMLSHHGPYTIFQISTPSTMADNHSIEFDDTSSTTQYIFRNSVSTTLLVFGVIHIEYRGHAVLLPPDSGPHLHPEVAGRAVSKKLRSGDRSIATYHSTHEIPLVSRDYGTSPGIRCLQGRQEFLASSLRSLGSHSPQRKSFSRSF
jgi:hypothetical protein